MTKFLQILLVASMAIALCTAEAPRYRSSRFQAQRNRNRVLARQEAAEAVTPYPSADELKPEVPFEETAPVEEANAAPNQPDETYGPPEIETDEEPATVEEEAAEAAAVEENQEPEPTADEEEEASIAAEEAEAVAQSERLIFGRRIAGRRTVRPAKLRAAPKTKSARLQQQQQQQFVAQPVFFYAAQGW